MPPVKPPHPRLFGKHLHKLKPEDQAKIRNNQFTRVIPVKAYGRRPTRESQEGLYHDEDYNFVTKVSRRGVTKCQKMLFPYVTAKTFHSDLLNCDIKMKVTLSAQDAIHQMGGFDDYIMRTQPEELRSATGDRLRRLMCFYMKRLDVKGWGLPASVMMSHNAQADPWYARHMYLLKKAKVGRKLARHCKKFSPYFLPKGNKTILGMQAKMPEKFTATPVNSWWKESPELESAFRRRLEKAKPFESGTFDPDQPGAYLKGKGKGGGQRHGRRRIKSRHRSRMRVIRA